MMNAEAFSKTLINCVNLLDKCGIYGNGAEDRAHVAHWMTESMKAKPFLWDIFEKSPFHNGRGQLIMPFEDIRPIDTSIVYEVLAWIRDEISHMMLEEAKCECYTKSEMDDYQRRLCNVVSSMDNIHTHTHWVFNGKRRDEILTEIDHWRKLINAADVYFRSDRSRYVSLFGKWYSKESYSTYQKVKYLCDALSSEIATTIDDESVVKGINNKFGTNFRVGTKTMSIIAKSFKKLGVLKKLDENPEIKAQYGRQIARMGDAISPLKTKKWSVLSINPVDYITASLGKNWTSCLNVDQALHIITGGHYSDGFNSRHTLDYSLDPSTMVFYTISADYNGDDWEIVPKSTRQLFHFDGNKLVQGRLYPQGETSRREIYTNYRHWVERALAEAMGVANMWSAPTRGLMETHGDTVDCQSYGNRFIDFVDEACHGGDECDFQSEVNYVVLRGDDNAQHNRVPMKIGSTKAFCLRCGVSLGRYHHENVFCSDCMRDFRRR